MSLRTRVDGHQGRNAADYVCSHLFSSLASKLFENPEDISAEVKAVFQEVDTTFCNEKAKKMNQLLKKKRRWCCLGKAKEESHEVAFLALL